MKEKYEAPSAEIISFEDSDVITTSTGTTGKSDVQTPSVSIRLEAFEFPQV